jgi:rhodanese-related sulfurtransferase
VSYASLLTNHFLACALQLLPQNEKEKSMNVKSMDVLALKDKFENHDDFVLVDVREVNEWETGHIPGAKFMPLSEFQEYYQSLDKNAEIILQCRSGKRSMSAALFLADQGYTNLSNLEGGILAWQEEGFDIES